MYAVVITLITQPASAASRRRSMSRFRPDDLMNDTARSTDSASDMDSFRASHRIGGDSCVIARLRSAS